LPFFITEGNTFFKLQNRKKMANSSSSLSVGKVVGVVVGLAVLGVTVWVVSKAWKKGQA
jgi:hypothetical protein